MITRRLVTIAVGLLVIAYVIGCNATKDLLQPERPKYPWMEAASATNRDPKDIPIAEHPEIQPYTYFAAGQLFEEQDQLGRAVLQYTKAIDADPDFVAAYNRMGICLDKLRQHQDAEQAFREAIKRLPEAAHLRNNLAFNLMVQKRLPEAERQLRKALELQPTYKRARTNLGVVLAKQKRYPEAFQEFSTALGESRAHYNMGLIYKSQGKKALASAEFQKSLAVDPSLSYARTQLKRLKPGVTAPAKNEPAEIQPQPVKVSKPTPVSNPASSRPQATAQPAVSTAPTTPAANVRQVQQNRTSNSFNARVVPAKPVYQAPQVHQAPAVQQARSVSRAPTRQPTRAAEPDVQLFIEQEPCDIHDMDLTVAELRAAMERCSRGNYADIYILGGPSSPKEDVLPLNPAPDQQPTDMLSGPLVLRATPTGSAATARSQATSRTPTTARTTRLAGHTASSTHLIIASDDPTMTLADIERFLSRVTGMFPTHWDHTSTF